MNKLYLFWLLIGILFCNSKDVLAAENVANDVFDAMVQTSKAKGYKTTSGYAVGFGSLSVRVANQNFGPAFKVTAPSMKYGCSGIDVNFGAFSLANKDEIIQQMRTLASGAAVYAFGAAVDALCGQCWAQMREWASQINEAGEFLKSSCESMQGDISSLMQDNITPINEWNIFKQSATEGQDSTHDDVYAAQGQKSTETLDESCGDECNYNLLYIKYMESDYATLSRTIGGINRSNKELLSLLMSLVGTYIVDVRNPGSDSSAQPIYKIPTIDIGNFLEGFNNRTNTKKTFVYECTSEGGKFFGDPGFQCLNVSSIEKDNWEGLIPKIENAINNVSEKLKNGSALDDEERIYIGFIPDGYRTLASSLKYEKGLDETIHIMATEVALQITQQLFKNFDVALRDILNSPSTKTLPRHQNEITNVEIKYHK
jgi:hypothetical protein